MMTLTVFLFAGPGSLQAKGRPAGGGGGHDGMPPGFSEGNKNGWDEGSTPPGWNKGEKEGWEDAGTPPGLSQQKEEDESDEKKEDKD